MLQITFTEAQIHVAKEIVQSLFIPFLGWLGKRSIQRLKLAVNEMITDNVNRIRDELVILMNKQFKEHEKSASDRLSNLEGMINGQNR